MRVLDQCMDDRLGIASINLAQHYVPKLLRVRVKIPPSYQFMINVS
jgi:hypothetical protein